MPPTFEYLWGDTWGGLWSDYEPRAARWIGQLLPPGLALDQCSPEMIDLLAATSEEWDLVYFVAAEIIRMLDPRELGFQFADWQRVTEQDIPFPQLTDLGGQDPLTYATIAAAYGYTDVVFKRTAIWNCESSCEAPLYSEEWNTTLVVEGSSLGSTIDSQFQAQLLARQQLGTLFLFTLL